METGLFTNRSAIHDTAQFAISKFYGGYIDALIDGSNMEVSNQLTVIRRPGSSQWSSVTIPNPPLWFYDWRKLDGTVNVIVDTSAASYLQTASTQTQIFTKSAGAGQGYYVGVGNTLYYGDGVDLQKYSNGAVSAWGITTPAKAPALVITPSASASVAWSASTVFTTMGLLLDSNGNIQQLISVNAAGGNTTQFGTTGNGQPAWNQSPGGTTTDNAWNWTNWGPIVAWSATHLYNNASVGGTLANPCIIYDPNTKCCFIVSNPGGASGTSGTSYPKFPAGVGQDVWDGGVKWFNLGTLKVPAPWTPSHSYNTLATGDHSTAGIVEPVSLVNGLPSNQTVFWQVNNTGGSQTSGTGGTAPPWATTVGTQTTDNQLLWLCLGTGTRVINHAYSAWTQNGTVFSVISDGTNLQVCTTSGTSSGTATGSITWSTSYGGTTQDGTVIWTCVGPAMAWAANTKWYLPATGWYPPGGATPYGGSIVTDGTNLEAVISSGKSQTPGPPSWNATLNGSTTDGGITWRNIGPPGAVGFSWTKGYQYAFSYESRLSTDQYNTIAPPDWPSPLGPPTGSQSGQISTASPLATITGGNPGAAVTLSGLGSTDPQVDTIVIWRTLDGGSSLFFLTEIPNPPAIGGNAQPWSVTDIQADSVLNELIPAPINAANNPPPAGFLPMAYHFGRIWGAVGNFVYCSGGGETVTGNPNESFNPSEYFQFPSAVTRIVPTATGIFVFLTSDVYAIQGGPVFTSFYATPMVPGVGLLHFNALDIHGGLIYLYTADNQFLGMDPSGGVSRLGQAIADKIALWDATKVFVTVHESGNDNAIFISDGSTGWYRLNQCQFPNGNPVWSNFAAITGGAGAVLSIEVSKGVHRLLIGGTGNNQPILQRDFSTYQDNAVSYTCFSTLGSINLCNPGQIAGLTFVNLRCTKTGTAPTVSFLLNEVSGSFTTFPSAQPYPWQIYAATTAPTSLYSNAYYFNATQVPALAEHMQVKWAFPAENFANEVLSLTVFGVIEQAPES